MPGSSKYLIIFTVVIICLLVACSEKKEKKVSSDILSEIMDTTVSPRDDFFKYATGGWIKKNPIPPAESTWGIGMLVQEDVYSRLRKINEDATAKNAAPGSLEQKIGDFWSSGMDTVLIEKQKLLPLKEDLDRISAIQTVDDLVKTAADFHYKGIRVFFIDGITQDDKNSEKMFYQVWQGGLGMPNREYYFNTDERTINVRKAYQEYIFKTLQQLGMDSGIAAKNAKLEYDLERKLAKSSRKLADLRDPERNYNKMEVARLYKIAPNMNWPVYTKAIGISNLDSINMSQPEFFSNLSNELVKTSIDTWKNYLRVHLVAALAPYLDSVTYTNYFEFRKKLTGAAEPRPRWKRVLDVEENAMGEALGQLFVKEYFSEKTRKRYADLVESIRNSFRDRIVKLDWMSDSTKKKALIKLSKVYPKVGYPDKWKDFSTMKIEKRAYVLNYLSANKWLHEYNINKLGKPVDRKEWMMSPQTYNAYYNPSNNEIVLPAAIFSVPGKMDEDLDDAFVYGYAAASTIGHEITHGFDDQGRQYDSLGNLSGWWAKSDSTAFVNKTKKIIAQFNEFNPVDTLHINGDATQGENIADLGGLLLGLDAYKKTEEYLRGEKIGNLTPLQRYFLGYAFGWTMELRKELLANLVMTDVHAPPAERVNGPMVNIPEFYDAFNIRKGDKMYREDSLRVSIW
jgi:putative endopeptidase